VASSVALRQRQELAQIIWREAPQCLDATVAQLAYQSGLDDSKIADPSIHRLWADGPRCRAWARHFPPASLEWAVHPDSPELFDEILDWFEEQAGPGVALETSARDADERAQATLRARGFTDDTEHPWMRLDHRSLDAIEEPELPSGYKLRTVADYGGEIAKRVAVHQRSWAELGTRVALDTYPGVMATWPYRSDLDFVLEADDGTPVAFALGWYDEANRLGEFEPLGTDPDYRRRGLGRALLLLGLRRFREAGATEAVVGCRGDEGHPLPRLLYRSVGFRGLSRQRWFRTWLRTKGESGERRARDSPPSFATCD
jgi:ribosomal protein S18 acetylase RimI-like enzyme